MDSPQTINREEESELMQALFAARHDSGIAQLLRLVEIRQQRALRMLTKCNTDEHIRYQAEYAAYQSILDAVLKSSNNGV